MSPSYKVADPAFRDRIRASFDRQGAMSTLGASLLSIEPGEVSIRLFGAPHISQQHGFVHGGVIAAVLDTACGYAASSLMPAEAGILTVEFKINFLAPAAGEIFEMIGRVRKAGRTLSLTDGDAYAVAGTERKLIATLTATMMTITGRDNIKA